MELKQQWCDNRACPDYGKIGGANLDIYSYAEHRYGCRTCGHTWSANKGTTFETLRSPRLRVVETVAELGERVSLRATARLKHHTANTVLEWMTLAGTQGAGVSRALLRNMHVGYAQVDELWTFVKKTRTSATGRWPGVWRLVDLAGARSAQSLTGRHRFEPGTQRSRSPHVFSAFQGSHRWAGPGLHERSTPRLYRRAHRHLQHPRAAPGQAEAGTPTQRTETDYRPRLAVCPSGQSSGRRAGGRSPAAPGVWRNRRDCRNLACDGVRNSNQHLVYRTRQSDFVRPHQALRVRLAVPGPAGQQWQQRTPAMVAGLTDHLWSLEELLSYRLPPPD